jgi:hypothetical protein
MGVTLALWAMVILACGQARLPMQPQPPGGDFLIIGHRGAPHQACENTLESFETALQLGVNALELDVSMTRDQQVVVWHDWVPSLKNALRPTGVCHVLRPWLPQPSHAVPLETYETIFAQLRHEAQRWYQTTQTHVELAFDTEGPQLLRVRAWPSTVHRNQRAGVPLPSGSPLSDAVTAVATAPSPMTYAVLRVVRSLAYPRMIALTRIGPLSGPPLFVRCSVTRCTRMVAAYQAGLP